MWEGGRRGRRPGGGGVEGAKAPQQQDVEGCYDNERDDQTCGSLHDNFTKRSHIYYIAIIAKHMNRIQKVVRLNKKRNNLRKAQICVVKKTPTE